MKDKKSDDWYPFWIDKWLFGSTRIELEPDERGVFVDLLTISRKDVGFIRANEGVPYLENQLCGLLNIKPSLLRRTIEKCLQYGKIKKLEDGTFFLISTEKYELSKRHKRRFRDMMSAKAAKVSSKTDSSPLLSSNLKSSLSFNKNLKEWEGIKEEDKKRWKEAYPACDIDLELKRMIEWIISNPEKGKKSNWRRFITNWLMRQQDRGGTKGGIQEDKHKAAREGTLRQFRDGEITYEEIVEISKKYNDPLLLEEIEKIRGLKK